jgi:hypothetical protein
MHIRKSYPILGLALLLALLVFSACGSTATAGSSNYSSAEVLQKSAQAMQKLKSAHIDLNSNVQASGTATAPTTTNDGSTPVPTSSEVNFTVKGSGDEQLPGQEQLDLTINVFDQAVNVAEVVKDGKVYVQNNQGKWFVLDKTAFQATPTPFTGVNIDPTTLLSAIQNLNVDDHGDEMLNGQSLRHITIKLDKNALKQVINSNPQLKGLFGQQDVDTVLSAVKSLDSSVDVWIDENDFYLHQTELKLTTSIDSSAINKNAPSSLWTKLDFTADLSKFNDPVTISAPTDATPISDPSALLGNKQP